MHESVHWDAAPVATHAAAINKHDGAAVAATFTTNGDEVCMTEALLTRRAAIRDATNPALAGREIDVAVRSLSLWR